MSIAKGTAMLLLIDDVPDHSPQNTPASLSSRLRINSKANS
ncbi:hypothetical protein [Nostoc sp. 106C]|nr:hypothetical protein [Nostoc sp. 106C]